MKHKTNSKLKLGGWVKSLRVGAVLLAAALAIGIGSAATNAWGPDRPTRSYKDPIDYVSFNNYVDGPAGDERNFFVIKDAANTSAGGWQDNVKIEDGKEYLARIYIHNNAAANLNLKATNTRVSVSMGQGGGNSIGMTAYVSADNAQPQKVWDEVSLSSDSKFNMQYVAGSATIYNNGYAAGGKGKAFSDSLVTSGASVGYAAEGDGVIPGCFEFATYITFKVRAVSVKAPDFNIDKRVRVNGEGEWVKSVTAKPGDKLQYRISYNNTGEVVQNNVVVKDVMPKGVTYTKGSTTVKNAANPEGLGLGVSDNMFSDSGINIGNYGPKTNAGIYYNAVVDQASGMKCGENKFINNASVETNNGGKRDSAEVIVNVECGPNECKPGVPNGDPRCEPCVPKEGEVVDSNGNCVPAALPTTGPAQVVAGIIGVALISLGVAYWIRSRKEYKRALAGFTDDFVDGPDEKLLEARTHDRTDNHASKFHR